MSVLIRGMEMPTSCSVCELCGCYNESKGEVYRCDITMHPVKFFERRLDNCPLIPVPEHGDLIDRDKLERDIDKYVGGEESRSRFHHWVQVQNVVVPGDKGEEK